jgi:hypothetical protein
MQQKIEEQHQRDEQGRPAGGYTLVVIDEDVPADIGIPLEARGVKLPWQNGPLKDAGGNVKKPNGLFVESLIAAAIGRLRFYEDSPFACRENALALTKLEEAQHWLQSRTHRRLAAGIEGTHGVQSGAERGGVTQPAIGQVAGAPLLDPKYGSPLAG